MFIGKSMWLANVRGCTLSLQKRNVLLIFALVEVQLALFLCKLFDEIDMVMKRGSWAVWRLMNFVQLARASIHFVAAEHRKYLTCGVISDGLIHFHPARIAPCLFDSGSCEVVTTPWHAKRNHDSPPRDLTAWNAPLSGTRAIRKNHIGEISSRGAITPTSESPAGLISF